MSDSVPQIYLGLRSILMLSEQAKIGKSEVLVEHLRKIKALFGLNRAFIYLS